MELKDGGGAMVGIYQVKSLRLFVNLGGLGLERDHKYRQAVVREYV